MGKWIYRNHLKERRNGKCERLIELTKLHYKYKNPRNISLEEISLSLLTYKYLKLHPEIKTLDDLTKYNKNYLLNELRFNIRTLNELEDILSTYGFCFL